MDHIIYYEDNFKIYNIHVDELFSLMMFKNQNTGYHTHKKIQIVKSI